MFVWLTSASGWLRLDDSGHLWERYYRGWVWHGPIESAYVSGHLERELAELLDEWTERVDMRAEVEWAYRGAKGM